MTAGAHGQRYVVFCPVSTAVWWPGMATDSTCSPTRSSSSSSSGDEERNIWNSALGLCCHKHGGQCIEDILTEEELGRVASP